MLIAETDRLTISWLTVADADFVFRLYNTDGFLKFVGNKNIRSLEDAQNYLQTGPLKMYREKGIGLYRVALRNSDEPLGICGLIQRDTLDDVDIGYGFLPEHEGCGYAIESAKAVMAYAKKELRLKRVVAITLPTNSGSIRLLRRLGLEYEREIEVHAGEPPVALYSIDIG